jgi:acyl-CoA synthetase (AMP-forming)/AMP-acid ligase II/short-subunit dehydrogenase/acyl carrier protein
MNNIYSKPSTILSHIQRQLLSHPSIYQCVAMQRINTLGQIIRVAYIVSDQAITIEKLKKNFSNNPDIQRLDYVMRLYSLPYLKSGEIDFSALEKFPLLTNALIKKITTQTNNPDDIYLDNLNNDEIALFKTINDKDSIIHGDKLKYKIDIHTLSELLKHTAKNYPENGIHIIEKNKPEEFFSYKNLLIEANKVAIGLAKNNFFYQTPILFQIKNIKEIFILFWGSILADCIPVPLAIPLQYHFNDQNAKKLIYTLDGLPDGVLVIDKSTLASSQFIRKHSIHNPLVLQIEKLRQNDPLEITSKLTNENGIVLYLQTSGSTSAPKLVPQTHLRLLHRSAASIQFNKLHDKDVSLNCFPLDHVCGLVMFHLRDVMLGCNQIHASISEFLANPLNLLNWCHKYKVTLTWAPNFAFNLINSYQNKFNNYQWNLSSIRFIENCAEPIVASQNLKFLQLLSRFGLNSNVIRPAWGMSETCSVMVLSDSFSDTHVDNEVRYVKVGKPFPNSSVRIVDEANQIIKQEINGKLQVKGNFIFNGYLNNKNEKSFTSDGWFDTGDIAQIIDDELVIVGRSKDIIIINGINIAAHEIERSIEQIDGVIPTFTAAVAVNNENSVADELAVFFVSDQIDDELKILVSKLCSKVSRDIGISPQYLFKVERAQIPKTTVGKIQKEKLRAAFNHNQFEPIYINKDFSHTKLIKIDSAFNKIWQRCESNSTNSLDLDTLLIFVQNQTLTLKLNELNAQYKSVILVYHGSIYTKLSGTSFLIDFVEPSHIEKLFRNVKGSLGHVSAIIYLRQSVQTSEFDDALFYLKANIKIYKYIIFSNIKISLLVNILLTDRNIPIQLANFLDAGTGCLMQTMNAEQNNFYCRSIEIEMENEVNLASIISTELGDISKEPEIKYKNNTRYVCRLQALSKQNTIQKIESKSTFLITGGLGGIAIHLAEKLLTEFASKIILCGRTDVNKLNAAQFNRLELLKEKYADSISYVEMNIENMANLSKIFQNNKIHGIFNLAACADDSLIIDLKDDALSKTISPKWRGTWNLYKLAEQYFIPLIVNFSSINSYFGGSRACAYSVANRVQEVISDYVNKNSQSVVMVNISWSMWNNIGLSHGSQYSELAKMQGYEILEPSQALEKMFTLLTTNQKSVLIGIDKTNERIKVKLYQAPCPAKILVTTTNKNNFTDVYDDFGNKVIVRFENKNNSKVTYPIQNSLMTRDLSTEVNAIAAPALMVDLIDIWRSVGIEYVDADVNIFELGTKSIMIPAILLKIYDRFKIDLSVVELFQFYNLNSLANYIQKKLNAI